MSMMDIGAAYEAPGALIAKAMDEARTLARLIAEADGAIDPRLRTVARLSDERRIADPLYEGPLAELIDGLERDIAAATRIEIRTVERGWDEHGATYDDEQVHVVDAAAAPLVPVRDRARAVAGVIDRIRDIIAVDRALDALRDGRRR